MSPEEVRMIVNEISPQLETPPWGAYVVAGLISILAAGVGAFFGSLLKKKGENKANDAHFETLSEQLKQNTKDTEKIKAAVTGQGWVKQQSWMSKEKYYTALISSISDWINAVSLLREYYDDPYSENIDDEDIVRVAELTKKTSDAAQAVRDLRGPSLIFLSKNTNQCIDSIFRMMFDNAQESMNTHDSLNRTFKGLFDHREKILKEAKEDLNTPFHDIE